MTYIVIIVVYTQGGITPLFLAIVYYPEMISPLLAIKQDLNKRDKVHFVLSSFILCFSFENSVSVSMARLH